MNVLAFDLGSTMGFSFVTMEGEYETGGEIKLIGDNRAQKLAHFMSWLDWFLTENEERINFIIYERPFARGLPATRMLWGYAAIVEAVSTQAGFAVLDELPTSVKKFATGKGNAKKNEMIDEANRRTGLVFGEHEADAFLLGAYAVQYLEK